MSNHKLGCHWLREHPDQWDIPHMAAMQYKSVKLFKPAWNNADFCGELLNALPQETIFLARDHELSEQKEDMWRDPVAAGTDHANQWLDKINQGQMFLPTQRTYFLGINEPDATDGDRTKIDIYTDTFLRRLSSYGYRGGAFNFSTGHPRTVDGTPNTPADYSVFERSHQAIVAGGHIAVLHIYGTGAVPCAPGHYDRLKACPWQDVRWIVGEFGVDEHVIGGGEHVGFHDHFHGRLHDYCAWLDTAIMGVNDPRIHSYQVFTYDFSHPWATFDVHPIRSALEGYSWQHASQPTQPPTEPPPVSGAKLIMPCAGTITQRFGENPADYARFGIPGHNGLDIGAPTGTPVVAVADGNVAWVDTDEDYGLYVRITHPPLGMDSFYAHLGEQHVRQGHTVKQGQVIGLVGSTGNSSGPHLHLEFRASHLGHYQDVTAGHGKGRFNPEDAYWLLDRVNL